MTNVTVQLSPETESRLREQASQRGESLETFIRHLAEKEAKADSEPCDMLCQSLKWLTNRSAEEMQAARQRIVNASVPPQALPAGKTVLDMVEGKWPGNETDAEIREALERLS